MEWLKNYWSIIFAAITLIFYVGFTKAEMQNKVDKNEVIEIMKEALNQYKIEMKDTYVKIEQVPGLNERLKAIEDQLKDSKGLTQKIYDTILGNK